MHEGKESLPLALKALRLSGMGKVWQEFAHRGRQENWTLEKYLSVLCDHELDQKEQNRMTKYQKEAHLPAGKTLSSFDVASLKSFDWPRFDALCHQTDWLSQGHNVFLFGASGLGKTHLAAALGHSLTLRGKRVLFTTTTALVQRLQQAHRRLALAQELMKLDRYQLLILDDVGYVRKDDQETHVLFELITHRYEHRSLLMTSNQPFAQWDRLFEDQAMTIAAVDRLVHHSSLFALEGESYRRRQALANQGLEPLQNHSKGAAEQSAEGESKGPDHPPEAKPKGEEAPEKEDKKDTLLEKNKQDESEKKSEKEGPMT